jgi:hypothetical protein
MAAIGGDRRHRACANALEAMGDVRGLDRLKQLLQFLELLATSNTYKVLSSPGFFPDLNSSALEIMQRCTGYICDHMTSVTARCG